MTPRSPSSTLAPRPSGAGTHASAQHPTPMPLRDALALTRRAAREAVRADVPGTQRGVALLIVLVTVAVMGALSTEFSYNTRTNIWMAGNVTADTQAYYHARSAIEIATLAVNAKKNFPEVKTALSLLGNANKLEIWRQACEFVRIFSSGKATFFGMDLVDMSHEEAVGVTKGEFKCEVTAEDSRVNLNAASTDPPHVQASRNARSGVIRGQGGGGRGGGGATALSGSKLSQAREKMGFKLLGMLLPYMESGQFDSEEEVLDVVLNVMDWTDADDNKTDIGPDGKFIESSASEAVDYSQHGYDVKNAKMDTVGELQLISGMPSDVYCKIRDNVTVFSTGKLNINDADIGSLAGVLCQAIRDEAQRDAACRFGGLPGQLPPMLLALDALEGCRRLRKAIYSTPIGGTTQLKQFLDRWSVKSGFPLNVNPGDLNQHLGSETRMVRIEAAGVYRGTRRAITTVIDMSNASTVYHHID